MAPCQKKAILPAYLLPLLSRPVNQTGGPVMKKSLLSSLALVLALSSALVAGPTARAHDEAPAVPGAAPVVFFEIQVTDLAKAKAFYGQLFKWKFQELAGIPDFAMIQTGKGSIQGGLAKTADAGKGGPSTVVSMAVSDVAAAMKRAAELGAWVQMPAAEIHRGLTLGQVRDPDGNILGLVHEENHKH
jgi:uncharacterized protein